MNTVPDLNKATAIAATGRTKAAAAVRAKLSSDGFSIDHPDSEVDEQLMMTPLTVTTGISVLRNNCAGIAGDDGCDIVEPDLMMFAQLRMANPG